MVLPSDLLLQEWLVPGFTLSWGIEFGVDLDALWQLTWDWFSDLNPDSESLQMVGNVFPAAIVLLIAKWELMCAGMRKEVKISFVPVVLDVESALQFAQEEC